MQTEKSLLQILMNLHEIHFCLQNFEFIHTNSSGFQVR